MYAATEAARNLREYRQAIRLSQSDLARGSGVSRYKLNAFEIGSGELNPAELSLILVTLQNERERLRRIPAPPIESRASRELLETEANLA